MNFAKSQIFFFYKKTRITQTTLIFIYHAGFFTFSPLGLASNTPYLSLFFAVTAAKHQDFSTETKGSRAIREPCFFAIKYYIIWAAYFLELFTHPLQPKDHYPLSGVITFKQVAAIYFIVKLKLIDCHKVAHKLIGRIIEKQKYLPWICIPGFNDSCHNLLQDLHRKWIKEITSVDLGRHLVFFRAG